LRAIIYTRVSTTDQTENFSLATQEKSCVEWCNRQNIEVAGVFREEGASAKTANRPVLQEAVNYCAVNAKDIDLFLVYKIDRFARRVLDHQTIRMTLLHFGITLRAVQETFDDSAAGHFAENIMAAAAQFDNEQRADRTRAGMRAAATSGKFLWRTPIGYIKPDGSTGPSLLPDPLAAPLITRAFEQYATGQRSKRDVLDEVTALGLTTRDGKVLSPQTFGSILKNPVYMGRVVSPSLKVDVEGDFEPLIGSDIFKRVQQVKNTFSKAEPSKRKFHPDFPLRRFIKCQTCGSSMTASWSKGRNERYGYYRCHRRGCLDVSVRKERLEEQFNEHLDRTAAKRPVLLLLASIIRDAWQERKVTEATAATAHEDRLAELKNRKQRLVEAFVYEKTLDSDTYNAENARLEREIEATVELRPSQHFSQDQFELALERTAATMTDLRTYWNQLEDQRRPDFLAAVFPDGLFHDGKSLGTVESPCFFYDGSLPDTIEEALVAPMGFEPTLPP
jgi:DNA invertase Pin-like site-specific DNA recombinase